MSRRCFRRVTVVIPLSRLAAPVREVPRPVRYYRVTPALAAAFGHFVVVRTEPPGGVDDRCPPRRPTRSQGRRERGRTHPRLPPRREPARRRIRRPNRAASRLTWTYPDATVAPSAAITIAFDLTARQARYAKTRSAGASRGPQVTRSPRSSSPGCHRARCWSLCCISSPPLIGRSRCHRPVARAATSTRMLFLRQHIEAPGA